MKVRIYCDKVTGTYGAASDIIEITATDEELDELEEMSDSSRIAWIELRKQQEQEGCPHGPRISYDATTWFCNLCGKQMP